MDKIYEIKSLTYKRGEPLPLGATVGARGEVNFSINSAHATSCTLVLYHKGGRRPYVEITLPASFKTGANYAIKVMGLKLEDVEYGYRFTGPRDKKAGLMFNAKKVLMDPYAKRVSGHDTWAKLDYKGAQYPFRSCLVTDTYDWEQDRPLDLPFEDAIIYEAHVRNYTAHASSKVACPGTFAGLQEKIPYLQELGINCLELLPIYDFNEHEFDDQPERLGVLNVWGYSPISFFAPKPGYAQQGTAVATEFKDLVKALHKAGIAVILDVVYNHTGEFAKNKQSKPLIYSLRGIDNPTYYILQKDGSDANYTGCMNTLNCGHPTVRALVLDSLRYWVTEFHVDGFRFDLASVLTRGMDGEVLPKGNLLEAIALDPLLAKTKLIAEAWDAAGLYQVGSLPAPARWSEWNDRFRNTLRGYLRGEALAGKDLVQRMQGSPDVFTTKDARAAINMVTCHDGFTLMDVCSYNTKHNLSNGDKNRDGSDWNVSWNCGCEGATTDKAILALRQQYVKNALTILLVSRGVPMLLAGDEFGNSQQGNNNAYCQDNEIAWLDWRDVEKHSDILALVKKLIALRKAHPVLRCKDFKEHKEKKSSLGYPVLSFHGTKVDDIHLDQPMLTFAALFAETKEHFAVAQDTLIYVGMNQYEKTQKMELPKLPDGFAWHLYADTKDTNYDEERVVLDYYYLQPRTVVVLLGQKQTDTKASALPK